MEKITSVKNPLIASLRALKGAKARRETGLFLVEGETMLKRRLPPALRRARCSPRKKRRSRRAFPKRGW